MEEKIDIGTRIPIPEEHRKLLQDLHEQTNIARNMMFVAGAEYAERERKMWRTIRRLFPHLAEWDLRVNFIQNVLEVEAKKSAALIRAEKWDLEREKQEEEKV